ncbi:MAG TPA: SpoIID/LytB domain-containing protein [Candidatus Babeliales bacterium]|nr:SpoIID/LytB domain-containing protein [Candidatus Babeliales bacterium]
MAFSYKFIIFFIFMHSNINAHRWPWVVTPSTSSIVSFNKKLVIRSHSYLCKSIISARINYLFPGEINFKSVSQQKNISKKHSISVRVLLAECDSVSSAQWFFNSSDGFIVQFSNGNDGVVKKKIKIKECTISVKRGCLFYNGKRLKAAIHLRPISAHGACNGTLYDGDFLIIPYKSTVLCINKVDLEDYITAVLKTESWPGWPLEVNKVFAVACRSYVMFKILEAYRSSRPFHVKNTNVHQTYQGRHELPVLRAAVEQTRGIVLGFNGKPILAMFDCCCGGIIPAHIDDFDFSKAPYLARTYACTYCKEFALYSWQVLYEYAVFEQLIKQQQDNFTKLHEVCITKRDRAGLVTEVRFDGPKYNVAISGKKLYSMLKEVKSFYFDVSKKAGKVIFTGRGFGHHIGLCQWGAFRQVLNGSDFRSILRFYYPGVYFMRLRG